MACTVKKDEFGNIIDVFNPKTGERDALYSSVLSRIHSDPELYFDADPFLRSLLAQGILTAKTKEQVALGIWSKIHQYYINKKNEKIEPLKPSGQPVIDKTLPLQAKPVAVATTPVAPVKPVAPVATGFQGYKGGFKDKGKGTSEGDGKDKAMREIADGFIGEVSSKRKSSTLTSAETISKKNEGGVPVFNYDSPPYLVLNGLGTNPENAKKVNEKLNAGELTFMLARNGSLANTPLTEQTKSSIKFIASKGNSFVVGDMPGADNYFIDYLQEIGAKFTIYHTGNTPRIDVKKPKPISQTTPAPTPTPQPTGPVQTISTKENPIVVYVDGSDIKGTGAIGFGVNTTFNNQEYSISGAFETSDLTKFEKDLGITLQNIPSNGVMEFYGSLVALRNTPKEEFVTIKQDLESVQLWILSGLLERLAKQTFTNKDKYSAWYNSLSEETKTDYHNRIQKVVGIDPKIVSKFNWDGRKGYFAEDKTIKVIQQKIIDILLDRKGQVKYEWVKGHSNDPGNDRVDTIAKDRKVYNTYRNLFQQGASEVSQFPTFNFPLEVGIQKIVEQLNKSEVGYDIFSFKGQQIIASKESVPEKKHKDSVRFYTINPISTLLYSERYGKPVKIPGYEEFTVFIEQDTGVPFLGSTGQSTTPAHTPLNISEDKMIEAIASEFRKFNIIKALEGAKTIPFFNPENNLKILFQYSDFKREEEEPTTENELGDDIILEDNIILEEDFQKLNQIEELFNENPELNRIGTIQQYASYLDTIFPDSKVKDIVYHYSMNKFEKFDKQFLGKNTNKDKRKVGYYFSDNRNLAELLYGTRNVQDIDLGTGEPIEKQEKGFGITAILNNPEIIKENDDISGYGDYVESNSYIVFDTEQIHILGGKQDIEGFKSFTQLNKSEEQEISELLDNKINDLLISGDITFTNEENQPCAAFGGKTSFTKGSEWSMVKDLKGYPSHADGGVDINLGKDGFSFIKDGATVKAAHGLVLPAIKAADGLVVSNEDPVPKRKLTEEERKNWESSLKQWVDVNYQGDFQKASDDLKKNPWNSPYAEGAVDVLDWTQKIGSGKITPPKDEYGLMGTVSSILDLAFIPVGAGVPGSAISSLRKAPQVALKKLSSASVSDEIIKKQGFDLNFLTRPLTPFTKNELTKIPGQNMAYRKIGNKKGLQDLIDKQGAQAPAPLKMKSGLSADTPFFGMGKKPDENYSGIFAVEADPFNPKYNWTNWVAGTNNYGVAPLDAKTGKLLKNLPLEDLNVYRKKWFSNSYKKLDKNNLEEGLKYADTQHYLEKLWKWGVRGGLAYHLTKDEESKEEDKNKKK